MGGRSSRRNPRRISRGIFVLAWIAAIGWAFYTQAPRLGLGPGLPIGTGRSQNPLISVDERRAAPVMRVATLDDATFELGSFRGQVVLIDFWATWCGPCREEIPSLVQLAAKYQARGVQLVGISMDDAAAPVRNFYRSQRMNYPVALGDVQLARAFGGVLGVPVKFFIDRHGRVAAKVAGPMTLEALSATLDALLNEPR